MNREFWNGTDIGEAMKRKITSEYLEEHVAYFYGKRWDNAFCTSN